VTECSVAVNRSWDVNGEASVHGTTDASSCGNLQCDRRCLLRYKGQSIMVCVRSLRPQANLGFEYSN